MPFVIVPDVTTEGIWSSSRVYGAGHEVVSEIHSALPIVKLTVGCTACVQTQSCIGNILSSNQEGTTSFRITEDLGGS
jgi:hypothetical protein